MLANWKRLGSIPKAMQSRAALFSAALLFAFAIAVGEAHALITGGTGNEAMTIEGLSPGALEVFNSQARVAWWEGPPFGGGQYHAECRGDAAAFNQCLQHFSQIKAPKKRLIIHDGKGRSFWLQNHRLNVDTQLKPEQHDTSIDWIATVWRHESWTNLRNMPSDLRGPQLDLDSETPIPVIEVYTNGNIDWSQVSLPEGLEVDDRRLSTHGFEPTAGIVLEGKITDMADQQPLVATIRLEKIVPRKKGGYQYELIQQVRTDESGCWTIQNAPSGWHQIVASAPGYAERVLDHYRFDNQPRWMECNATLAKATTVHGKVTAESSGPIEGAEVLLRNVQSSDRLRYEGPASYRAKTNQEGEFTIEGTPVGSVSISVYKPGYSHPGPGLETATPAKNLVLEMVRASVVQISVKTPAGQPPQGGYVVEIGPTGGAKRGSWGGSANIDPLGEVQFTDVPPGEYKVVGRPNPGSKDEQTDAQVIKVVGGETQTIALLAK